MYVIKRDGRKELVKFDKITARIQKIMLWLKSVGSARKGSNESY